MKLLHCTAMATLNNLARFKVSSSGITNIATGAKAADQTLMKLCCDKIKPAACCSTTLKDLQSFGSYDTKTNFTKLQKANVCKSVSTCVMKQYTDETLPAACFSKPWTYKAHKTPVTLTRPNCKMMSMTSSGNQTGKTGRTRQTK